MAGRGSWTGDRVRRSGGPGGRAGVRGGGAGVRGCVRGRNAWPQDKRAAWRKCPADAEIRCRSAPGRDRLCGESRRARVRSYRGIMVRSEEHTSELQSLMRISYAVFCLKKKKNTKKTLVSKDNE